MVWVVYCVLCVWLLPLPLLLLSDCCRVVVRLLCGCWFGVRLSVCCVIGSCLIVVCKLFVKWLFVVCLLCGCCLLVYLCVCCVLCVLVFGWLGVACCLLVGWCLCCLCVASGLVVCRVFVRCALFVVLSVCWFVCCVLAVCLLVGCLCVICCCLLAVLLVCVPMGSFVCLCVCLAGWCLCVVYVCCLCAACVLLDVCCCVKLIVVCCCLLFPVPCCCSLLVVGWLFVVFGRRLAVGSLLVRCGLVGGWLVIGCLLAVVCVCY